MAWLRIDDGFDSHPKILALGSDQRRWTWARILVYTCRYKSPTIPSYITESIPRATPQFLRECVEIGLVDDTDEGLIVHDWDHYNGPDARVLVRERVQKHRAKTSARNGDVTADVTDEPLPERYSRAGARARPVPNPINPSPTPPQPGEEDTNDQDQERMQAWLDYASRQPGITATLAYARQGHATGAWPPTEQHTPDPSATCPDCGERLGHGHTDDCPTVIKAATRAATPTTTTEPERIAPPADFLTLAGHTPRPAPPTPPPL